MAAGLGAPGEHALISLLALNGLRVSEATGASIENLGVERGHRTLVVTRKGGKVVTIPLAPRTARAIDLAVGERVDGPIFGGADGQRLDRHCAARVVRRAGITKPVGPHTLRHAFITAALDAGVPVRDVQEAASHADPRTTMRYDRARGSLDRHATCRRLPCRSRPVSGPDWPQADSAWPEPAARRSPGGGLAPRWATREPSRFARYLARTPADPARTLCGRSRALGGRGSGDGDGDLAAGVVSEHVGDGGGGVVKGVGRIDDHLDGAGFQQAG